MNDKKEMGKMLAANQDLHARRADRIAEELEVSLRNAIYGEIRSTANCDLIWLGL